MLSTKHVFLIGFMGSGKTTIGRMLSIATNLPFVDLDEEVERSKGKPVSILFETVGEASFREMEREALLNCTKESPCVISTGGGLPCFFDNVMVMKQVGITIYLKASPNELAARLAYAGKKRPLLKGIKDVDLPSHIDSMLSVREPYYLRADHVVETDGHTDESVLKLCMDIVHSYTK